MDFPRYNEDILNLFKQPARIIVSGMTNSGKTQICTKLVMKYHTAFDLIIVSGCSYHPLQDEPELASKVTIKNEIVNPWDYKSKDDRVLIILDDCFIAANNNEIVSDVFTKGRHANISCILVTQNIFPQGKHSRNISLNASHFLLLKQRDLGQIECFARQLFGRENAKKFIDIYKNAVLSKTYGYILIDIAAGTPEELQLRGNLFQENHPHEIVYQWS